LSLCWFRPTNFSTMSNVEYAEEEGIYEVEDLLDHKHIDGKDYFLVRWKSYSDTSWEPDENIGQELQKLKDAAKQGAAGGEGKKTRQ
jgi:hypothetical protein